MISRNARMAIHNAFASHLTTPDPGNPGLGTKIDVNAILFYNMKAGLVMSAATKQDTHLASMAVFINAPDGSIFDSELEALKVQLWKDFLRQAKPRVNDQAEIMVVLDKIMIGFKFRAWNHTSEKFKTETFYRHKDKKTAARLRLLTNTVVNILQDYDERSLAPVWKLFREQKELLEKAEEEALNDAKDNEEAEGGS